MGSYINTLGMIEAAKQRTGSDGLTAKAIGVSASRLSEWRHAKRNLPISAVVRLVDLLELPAEEQLRHIRAAARHSL